MKKGRYTKEENSVIMQILYITENRCGACPFMGGRTGKTVRCGTVPWKQNGGKIMFQFRRNFREVNPENGKTSGGSKLNLKKAKRITAAVVLAALALVIANSCWFTIQEEQQAVVCTFGQPKAVTDPGLHFKIPFIQTVTKVNTTIQVLSVGYDDEENYTDDDMMITSD